MNGIYVGPAEEAYLLFNLLCTRDFDTTLIQCDTPEEAAFALRNRPHDFVVMELPVQDSLDLLTFLEEEQSSIPLLLTASKNNMGLVDKYKDHGNYFDHVSYQSAELVIIKTLEKILKKQKEAGRKLKRSYYPVPAKLFLKIPTTNFDIFLRLTEMKYLKIFKKSDIITPMDIKHYIDKDVTDFYLLAEDFLNATGSFIKQVSDVLKEQDLDTKTMTALAKFSHNAASTMIKDLGIKDEIIEIVHESIEAIEKMQMKDPNLINHFNNILKGKDYMSEHTLMLIFLSCAMAQEADWGSQFTAKKLTLAAFFHDLGAYADNIPTNLLLHKGDPRNIEELAPNILRELLNHPFRSVELISGLPDLSPEVEQIIKLHHEAYDGSGYPSGLTDKKIFPLAVIMIVAEEFIDELYRQKKKPGVVKSCLEQMEANYKDGNFGKAARCLRSALSLAHTS